MEDDLSGRQPQWKTTSLEDSLSGNSPQWKTTSVEGDLSGRRPYWKMTSVEDDLSGWRPPWKTDSVEKDISGRQPQWKTTSVEDDLSGRRSQWKTISVEDNLIGRQTQWKRTSVEDDLISFESAKHLLVYSSRVWNNFEKMEDGLHGRQHQYKLNLSQLEPELGSAQPQLVPSIFWYSYQVCQILSCHLYWIGYNLWETQYEEKPQYLQHTVIRMSQPSGQSYENFSWELKYKLLLQQKGLSWGSGIKDLSLGNTNIKITHHKFCWYPPTTSHPPCYMCWEA